MPFVMIGFFGDDDDFGGFFFTELFDPVPPAAFPFETTPFAPGSPVSAPAAAAFFFRAAADAAAAEVGTLTCPFGPIFIRSRLGWSSWRETGGAVA